MGASSRETCHAREREHPDCRDAARLAACAALDGFLSGYGSPRPFGVLHVWIPAFAGIQTRGLVDRVSGRLPSSDTARQHGLRTVFVPRPLGSLGNGVGLGRRRL